MDSDLVFTVPYLSLCTLSWDLFPVHEWDPGREGSLCVLGDPLSTEREKVSKIVVVIGKIV